MLKDQVRIGDRVRIEHPALNFSGCGEVAGVASDTGLVKTFIIILDAPLPNGWKAVSLTPELFELS